MKHIKLYITPDNIGIESGGGHVTRNELEALKSFNSSNDSNYKKNNDVIIIDANDIIPTKFGLPDTPFLSDYLTLEKLSHTDLSTISIAQFYSGPFGQSINYLKANDIITVNTYDAHDRTESINEFENLGYSYPYIHVKNDYLWKIYFAGAKNADVLIVPSNLSKNFLRNEGCTQRIEIIPHGCYIPEKIEPIPPIPDQFNIGYLGQLGPDKGLRYLIESFSNLGYKDSTLIFAGIGTESLGPFINKYATDGKFHLMGYVKNTSDFYNLCSIYIQPSVTESFGIEVLEAMAHGRPVICSEGAGSSDLVENDINGFVVPKRDIKAISDKIEWFKNHPNELKEMGKNAKDIASKYSWCIIKEKYIDLWRSIS